MISGCNNLDSDLIKQQMTQNIKYIDFIVDNNYLETMKIDASTSEEILNLVNRSRKLHMGKEVNKNRFHYILLFHTSDPPSQFNVCISDEFVMIVNYFELFPIELSDLVLGRYPKRLEKKPNIYISVDKDKIDRIIRTLENQYQLRQVK